MLTTETETAILSRVIRPEIGGISPEGAKALLSLGFLESDHARMEELSNKAQEGSLDSAEQEELDGYINVSHLIAFIQSKARISLRDAGQSSSAA